MAACVGCRTNLNMKNFETEWNKMLRGEIYEATDPRFLELLQRTRELLWEYNSLNPAREKEREQIIRNLLGRCGSHFQINQPFRCDYGCNISIGENFFANFNLTILDEATVSFGDNVFIGPNVSIYTACHPLQADLRDTGVEWAEPVTVGNSVWIGGSATILPGVTVGDRAVIGAGSVVTRDVAPGTVVTGNPARYLKMADNSKLPAENLAR